MMKPVTARTFLWLLPALLLAGVSRAADTSPLDGLLGFDAEEKSVRVQAGEPAAHFRFEVTNISPNPIKIIAAIASCGCTVAKLPAQPWVLAPGAGGEIQVTLDVTGKSGEVTKFVYINAAQGIKSLAVKVTILPSAASERDANRVLAAADRQAVFKGDCARCHLEPAKNKRAEELYGAACAICHESAHRASIVPDLRALPNATGPEFWRAAIALGKPGTLMPAFAAAEGGFLTDAQIASLVTYLTTMVPARPAPSEAPAP